MTFLNQPTWYHLSLYGSCRSTSWTLFPNRVKLLRNPVFPALQILSKCAKLGLTVTYTLCSDFNSHQIFITDFSHYVYQCMFVSSSAHYIQRSASIRAPKFPPLYYKTTGMMRYICFLFKATTAHCHLYQNGNESKRPSFLCVFLTLSTSLK